jgi:hypothetical protein
MPSILAFENVTFHMFIKSVMTLEEIMKTSFEDQKPTAPISFFLISRSIADCLRPSNSESDSGLSKLYFYSSF